MENYKKFNLTQNEFNLICDTQNGVIIDFDNTLWKHNITCHLCDMIEQYKLDEKWEVNKESLIKKLLSLSDIKFLKLINEVDLFWNRDPYSISRLKSPSTKILEIKNTVEKHEPIIWTDGNGSIEEFLIVSKGIGLELIIYVQDFEGDNKSVWATLEKDLKKCLFKFSDIYHFGRIQRIDDALYYGFFDTILDC